MKRVMLVCGGLLTVWFLIASSESFQTCEHERKHHQGYAALQKKVGLLIHSIVRLKLAAACVRFTAGENDGSIVAIFTIVLAIYTVRLASATDTLVRDARDTVRSQLRAYVSFSAATIDHKDPSRPAVTVQFKNCGATPSYKTRSWVHMWVCAHPLTEKLPTPEPGFLTAKTTVGPGAMFSHYIAREPPLTAWQQQIVGTPIATIYVYGRVEYVDSFGSNRFTDFRLIYGGNEGTRQGMLMPDSDGNEAS